MADLATSKRDLLPHVVRPLSRRDPHHVVLTARRDVPPLHRREIRDLWRKLQTEAGERYPGVSFSAGCLMPSHLHLVVQATGSGATISRAIQFLASKFALGINRIARRRGQVFQDRFFSRVVSTVSDLVRVIRYVGQNPVRAGLVRRPEDWVASSVPDCLDRSRTPSHWSFRGWMYRVLGFFDDPQAALVRILNGETRARSPGRSRQNRLPFGRGLDQATARNS